MPLGDGFGREKNFGHWGKPPIKYSAETQPWKQKRAAGKTARGNAYLSVSRRTWHLAHTRRLSGFIGPVPSAALDKLLFCCCEVSVPQVFGKVNDISLCSSDGLHKSGADAAACVVLEESLPHRGKVAEAPPEAG